MNDREHLLDELARTSDYLARNPGDRREISKRSRIEAELDRIEACTACNLPPAACRCDFCFNCGAVMPERGPCKPCLAATMRAFAAASAALRRGSDDELLDVDLRHAARVAAEQLADVLLAGGVA